MSRAGEYAAGRVKGDGSIRRRMDVTRFFAVHPGERVTVNEVAEHTVGGVDKVHDLLEELTGSGWLRSGKDADHRVVYWREVEVRRGA